MRKWLLAVVGTGTAVAIVGVAVVMFMYRPAPPAAGQPAPPQTAVIVRTDLSTSVSLEGSLGYGTATTLTGRKAGTVTWLPAVGTVVGQGQKLYAVDAKPVVLFLGDTPLYRTIDGTATPGPDIAEINANLRALGYRLAPTGNAYSAGTVNALKQWQHRNGLDETGTLAAGDVAVLPAPVRVASLKVQPGAPAAADLLGLTSTTKLVTATVDPTKVDTSTLKPGQQVALSLPTNAQAQGTIATLNSPEPTGSSTNQGSSQPGETVTVAIGDQSTVSGMDSGAVEVIVTTGSHKGVLAVPIGALVVVQGGGYAVQVVTGHTSTLVGVQTGLFANGLVEVSGQGITEGQKVVTVS